MAERSWSSMGLSFRLEKEEVRSGRAMAIAMVGAWDSFLLVI